MKPIEFSKTFEKAYKKRVIPNAKLRSVYGKRYKLFALGIRDYPIDDHVLTGKMVDKRAWSAASDLRVIYRETDDAIIFLDIGTHNQVYGK